MDIRELFRRFRPAGTPGAAVAVPDDPARRNAVELDPVFAALAAANTAAGVIRAAAERKAAERERSAADEAARITGTARRDARIVRDEAFATAQDEIRRTGAALIATARADAAAIVAAGPDVLTGAADIVAEAAMRAAGVGGSPPPGASP